MIGSNSEIVVVVFFGFVWFGVTTGSNGLSGVGMITVVFGFISSTTAGSSGTTTTGLGFVELVV